MSDELPPLIASLDLLDHAIELCALTGDRATAKALRTRISLMQERIIAVVIKLAPAPPPVVELPESGGLPPAATRGALAHGMAAGWPPEMFEARTLH
jgi:hypothetical protein